MRITNKYNLPAELIKIVELNERVPVAHHYSVTELLKPIKEIILWRRYYDIINQDISELVTAAFGTAFHTMMESVSTGGTEERVEREISDGVSLSGRYDKLENYTLYDYKTTSVWKYQNGDFSDYKKQGLMYAWLLRKNGLYVDKLVFYMFLKDHSLSRKRFQTDYPDTAFGIYEHTISAIDMVEIENYITERIKLIEFYLEYKDDDLPYPTHVESWYTGDKYAVMKNGSARAVKLCDTRAEAEKYKGDYIEVRYGEHLKSYFSEFFRNYVMYKKGE
jgi:hypothetical protein